MRTYFQRVEPWPCELRAVQNGRLVLLVVDHLGIFFDEEKDWSGRRSFIRVRDPVPPPPPWEAFREAHLVHKDARDAFAGLSGLSAPNGWPQLEAAYTAWREGL